MVNYSYFNRLRLLFRASGKCLKGPSFLFFIVRSANTPEASYNGLFQILDKSGNIKGVLARTKAYLF
jgi:hypothetical protein